MEFTLIGHTKKAYGVKGELKTQIFEEYLDSLFQTEVVFIELQGQKVPFFIEGITDQVPPLLKLEEIDNKEASLKIAGKKLFLRAKDVVETTTTDDLVYSYCVGFTIVDTEQGQIGVIEEVLEFPQQEMAVLSHQNKEIFIPLNEQLIEAINENDKVVKMTLPLGILEL